MQSRFAVSPRAGQKPFAARLWRDLRANGSLYLLMLPVIVFYFIFSYIPMGGVLIAFKDYSLKKGVLGSPWAGMFGLAHFVTFVTDPFFLRLVRNTVLISLYNLVFGFPAPILLALLLNELKGRVYKRVVQTISYFPHFISTVVICGMITEFSLSDGLFNQLRFAFGAQEGVSFLQETRYFRTIYTASGVWQSVGWGSIIYLASIAGVDPQLYEAAALDGAGRLRCVWHITLPGIRNTAVILLIMQIGRLLSVGSEKILLLYNATTYEVADVISTYVYRRGLLEFDFSYSTAVSLFNSVIGFALVFIANFISGKVSETSLF